MRFAPIWRLWISNNFLFIIISFSLISRYGYFMIFLFNYLCVPWYARRDTTTIFIEIDQNTHDTTSNFSNSRIRDGNNNGRWWLSSQQWMSQEPKQPKTGAMILLRNWFLFFFDVTLCGIYWCSDMIGRFLVNNSSACVSRACPEQANSCTIDLAVNRNIFNSIFAICPNPPKSR